MCEGTDVRDEVFREVFGLGEGIHEGGAHFVGVPGSTEETYKAVGEGDIGSYGEDSLGDGFAKTGELWRGRRGGKAPALILEVVQVVERHPLCRPSQEMKCKWTRREGSRRVLLCSWLYQHLDRGYVGSDVGCKIVIIRKFTSQFVNNVNVPSKSSTHFTMINCPIESKRCN